MPLQSSPIQSLIIAQLYVQQGVLHFISPSTVIVYCAQLFCNTVIQLRHLWHGQYSIVFCRVGNHGNAPPPPPPGLLLHIFTFFQDKLLPYIYMAISGRRSEGKCGGGSEYIWSQEPPEPVPQSQNWDGLVWLVQHYWHHLRFQLARKQFSIKLFADIALSGLSRSIPPHCSLSSVFTTFCPPCSGVIPYRSDKVYSFLGSILPSSPTDISEALSGAQEHV